MVISIHTWQTKNDTQLELLQATATGMIRPSETSPRKIIIWFIICIILVMMLSWISLSVKLQENSYM